MLIYNKNFSVSPITTHLPLKNVSKLITKKKIIANVNRINHFYISKLKKKPVIAILGLNPIVKQPAYIVKKKNNRAFNKILKKKKSKYFWPFFCRYFFFSEKILLNLMLLLVCITTRY